MNLRSAYLIVLLVGGASAITWSLIKPPKSPSAAPEAKPSAPRRQERADVQPQIRTLDTETRHLQGDVAELRTEIRQLKAAQQELSPPAPAAPPSEPALSEEERSAREQTFFAAEHAAEVIDPAWSRDQAARFRQTLSESAFAGNRLTDVDCRTKWCRLVVHHDTEDALDRMTEAVIANSDAFKTPFVSYFDRAQNASTLYVLRDGVPMPSPEALTH